MAFRISTAFVIYAFITQLTLTIAAPAHSFYIRHEGHDDDKSSSSSNADIKKQNGLDAQKLNSQFATLKSTDSCQAGSMACVNNSFAQCVDGKWALSPCPSGLQCFALPLVNKQGTSLVCDTKEDALARITSSGATGG
ncbi:hypothetical protein AMATHDRAFT_144960, partial [Amanita thiersii Skay4041]